MRTTHTLSALLAAGAVCQAQNDATSSDTETILTGVTRETTDTRLTGVTRGTSVHPSSETILTGVTRETTIPPTPTGTNSVTASAALSAPNSVLAMGVAVFMLAAAMYW
jgi:hypothetical protein